MPKVTNTSMSRLEIQRHRLNNGLQVVLQPDSSLPLVAVNVWSHVGSKNEKPGRTGFDELIGGLPRPGLAASGHCPDTRSSFCRPRPG